MSKLLVFIPCYRCEKQIERVVYKLKLSGIEADLLLVDNRSPDNTLQNAQAALEKHGIQHATILMNKGNYNLGGSHKVAFSYALEHGYTHVIVLHGDDQADLRDILPLLQSGQHLKYDCLLGSRFHPSSRLEGYSQFRIFGNKVLNLFCNLVCGESISDMGSGLNMYNSRFIKDMRYMTFPDDLTFNVSLLFHSFISGYKTSFFPISWREEDQISNAKVFRQMKIILKTIMATLKDRAALYSGKRGHYPSEVVYKK